MEQNIESLKKSAEQGDAEALYQLGNCYQNGEGVEQDIKKAVEWWLKAADLGHEKASELIQKINLIMKLI
ncbi:MAG: SEL1-like repeat protein [Treponema sp.]|nr:SEL1-like repeat protein [Treponema sp.]